MGEYLAYVECPDCDGTGGPPWVWDEDTQTFYAYACSSCGGQGYRREWRDD